MRTAVTMEYESDWNWKVMVENCIESYHHIGVHRDTLEPLFPAHFTSHDDTDRPFVYHHIPTKDRAPMPSKFPLPSDLTEEQRTELLVINVYPYFLIALQPDEPDRATARRDDVAADHPRRRWQALGSLVHMLAAGCIRGSRDRVEAHNLEGHN
jgi:hypothetical protein